MKRVLPFILLILVCAARADAAPQCREGRSLPVLVNNADAIAVVEEFEERRFSASAWLQQNKVFVRFLEFLKAPLWIDFDRRTPQAVYSDVVMPTNLLGKRRYLAFLSYYGPNAWRVRRCEMLNIQADDMVQEACTAISDLFGANPYERERRCLLAYPPSAPLADIRIEVQKFLFSGRRFSGKGRIHQDGWWAKGSPYQFLVMELDARDQREFFALPKIVAAAPIKAYIKSAGLDEGVFRRQVHKGATLEFQGEWQAGSFIIDAAAGPGGRPLGRR